MFYLKKYFLLLLFLITTTILFSGKYPLGERGLPKNYKNTIHKQQQVPRRMLPNSYNWLKKGKVTFAKYSNENCGACWAYTATAVFESKLLIMGYGRFDLSENQQLACNNNMSGCGGGDMESLKFWISKGPQEESCSKVELICGGENNDKGCITKDCGTNYSCKELNFRVKKYYTVEQYNTGAFKLSLFNDGPGYFYFEFYDDFYDFWDFGNKDDVYIQKGGERLVEHSVLLIGWDNTKKAWFCKNNWGQTGPNRDGTFWIGYHDSGHKEDLNFGMANIKIKNLK